MKTIITVKLPSFLRRIVNSDVLKAHIKETGCNLTRIGRSRNWQLKASVSQLQNIVLFIEYENEDSWIWLSTLLKKEYLHLSHDSLLALARRLDNVTITSLMAHTDCTLVQARKILDELEVFD